MCPLGPSAWDGKASFPAQLTPTRNISLSQCYCAPLHSVIMICMVSQGLAGQAPAVQSGIPVGGTYSASHPRKTGTTRAMEELRPMTHPKSHTVGGWQCWHRTDATLPNSRMLQ